MTNNSVPDVSTPAPSGNVNARKLLIHFYLYGPPVGREPNDSTEKGAVNDCVTFQLTLEVSTEEARRIYELVGSPGAVVVKAQERDGQAHVSPVLLPTHRR